ncbi:hypothetical protein LJK88_11995 [Paenibacillus sp. P26]|nr:hypothetical protein LJK88_11995 [Paenibacillus sp. P26]
MNLRLLHNDIRQKVMPLTGEAICLFFAGLLRFGRTDSVSGRRLALVFLTLATVYISLGASVRGTYGARF